jgi:cytidine diphosphoramidate kinase
MVIWLIGLSGAGKTTIGKAVYRRWKTLAPDTVLVDGDDMRRIFGQDQSPADYSVSGRRRNAERIFEICAWLDRQDLNVVCCILSIFPDMQERNRREFSRYFEVFVHAPIDKLAQRDDKRLYGPALAGSTRNVVGVDIEFPAPPNPDLIIDNGRFDTAPEHWAEQILRQAAVLEQGRT